MGIGGSDTGADAGDSMASVLRLSCVGVVGCVSLNTSYQKRQSATHLGTSVLATRPGSDDIRGVFLMSS
jgi:hypothetical protein